MNALEKSIAIAALFITLALQGCVSQNQAAGQAPLSAKTPYGFDAYSKNPDDCKGIADNSSRDLCYTVVAANTKQAPICGKIGISIKKDVCIASVARVLGDFSLCGQIIDNTTKNVCYGRGG